MLLTAPNHEGHEEESADAARVVSSLRGFRALRDRRVKFSCSSGEYAEEKGQTGRECRTSGPEGTRLPQMRGCKSFLVLFVKKDLLALPCLIFFSKG